MTTLLLRLAGPMQSWGTSSRFSLRDAGRSPSKSGVVGLLCAALGRPRSAPLADLAGLTMAVRIDRPGILERDFQTALEVPRAGNSGSQTVVSHRQYLADADFLVGFEGSGELLDQAHQALRNPTWPLFLGRKGYVPGASVYLPDGLREASVLEALRAYPWPEGGTSNNQRVLEFVVEDEQGDALRDVPLCFENGHRRFGTRRVRRVRLGPIPNGD